MCSVYAIYGHKNTVVLNLLWVGYHNYFTSLRQSWGQMLSEEWEINRLPYEGKLWWGEMLANLVNRPWFAKLKLVLIINNLLPNLLICQTFFRQMLKTSQFAKFSPTKLPSIQYISQALISLLLTLVCNWSQPIIMYVWCNYS